MASEQRTTNHELRTARALVARHSVLITCRPTGYPMSSIRVLVVTNMSPNVADPGYGSFVRDQMDSVQALGVEYEVLFVDGRASRGNYLRAIGRVRSKLREKPYDLIHAHFGLSGWVARCQLRRPLVVTFHGDDVLGRPNRQGGITLVGRLFQATSWMLARLVPAVIVQSLEMKAKLGLERACIIPCGVDLNLFRPADREQARERLGLEAKKKYVLFPYNPAEPRKRYDLIEQAVRLAQREVPEIEVLRVYAQPHERMPLYMNAADVLVLASMIEGSPVAVKEALAVNLPVVAVAVGDTPERLEGVKGCYLVPRQPEAIAARIREVCRSGMRAESRAAVEPLAMEKIAGQILEAYTAAMRNE